MAYTHDDVFKPLPGYKVLASHLHFDFNEMLPETRAVSTKEPPWADVLHQFGHQRCEPGRLP